MHKLIALYHPPKSEEDFRNHLVKVHLPLVAKFPKLRSLRYGFGAEAGPQPSPYYAVVECEFDDEASLRAALASPEGEAAAADVPNYATAGVTIITFPLEPDFVGGSIGRTT
ncbi:EthD family reductase [Bradyrhizobium sp. USDA 3256]